MIPQSDSPVNRVGERIFIGNTREEKDLLAYSYQPHYTKTDPYRKTLKLTKTHVEIRYTYQDRRFMGTHAITVRGLAEEVGIKPETLLERLVELEDREFLHFEVRMDRRRPSKYDCDLVIHDFAGWDVANAQYVEGTLGYLPAANIEKADAQANVPEGIGELRCKSEQPALNPAPPIPTVADSDAARVHESDESGLDLGEQREAHDRVQAPAAAPQSSKPERTIAQQHPVKPEIHLPPIPNIALSALNALADFTPIPAEVVEGTLRDVLATDARMGWEYLAGQARVFLARYREDAFYRDHPESRFVKWMFDAGAHWVKEHPKPKTATVTRREPEARETPTPLLPAELFADLDLPDRILPLCQNPEVDPEQGFLRDQLNRLGIAPQAIRDRRAQARQTAAAG